VLFELISARYERRSLLITANQPFGEYAFSSRSPRYTMTPAQRGGRCAALQDGPGAHEAFERSGAQRRCTPLINKKVSHYLISSNTIPPC